MIVDSQGTPLVIALSPANTRDERLVKPLLNRLLDEQSSGVRRPPGMLYGDRGYGFAHIIQAVNQMGIESMLAPRVGESPKHGSGLGTVRRVVEQTLSNLSHCRRIKLCYEKIGAHFQAFNELAATLLCWKRLQYYRRL